MSGNLTTGKPSTPRSKAHPRRFDRLRLVLDGPKVSDSPLVESKQNTSKMALNVGTDFFPRKLTSYSIPTSPQSTQTISSSTAESWSDRSRIRSSWREERMNQLLREQGAGGMHPHNVGTPIEKNFQNKLRTLTNLRIETETEKDEKKQVVSGTPSVAEKEEILLKVESVVVSAKKLEVSERKSIVRIQAVGRGNVDRKNYSLKVSALRIQTLWRGFLARRERNVLLMKRSLEASAAIKLQAIWRMLSQQTMFKKYISARKIQSMWRSYVCRVHYWLYLRSKEAAIKIQSAWRSFSSCRAFAMTMYDIVLIQSVARGYIGRLKLMRYRGACDIQRLYRGHKCRKGFRIVWIHHVKNKSAIMLQRVYRGIVIRRTVARAKVLIDAAVTIQSHWRRYEAQLRLWILLGCIIHMQKMVRGYLARIKFYDELGRVILSQIVVRRWLACRATDRIRNMKRERAASTRIQATVRRFICRLSFLKYKREKLAATIIQSQWRCFVCCTDYIFTIADIVTIQRLTRKLIKCRIAAIKIQSMWRSHVCYEDYCMIQHDVVTIQRVIRGHFGRKIFETQQAYEQSRNKGAISLQRLFRGSRGRKDAIQIRHENQIKTAATVIQSQWRTYRAQESLWGKIDSAIQIQSWFRGLLCRLEYIDCIGSIILSQCAARRWLARRALLHKCLLSEVCYFSIEEKIVEDSAATCIQSLYRNHTRPRLHNAAATKVQSFFRMVKAIIERQVAMEMRRRSVQARRRKAAAIAIQSIYRMVLAVREKEVRTWKKIREFSAIKIQTSYRRIHSMKKLAAFLNDRRQNQAATKIQSFFRMVKAMVDREIKVLMRRRKIRKMMKNRTKEIDDLMLEEAWSEMPSSFQCVESPTNTSTRNIGSSHIKSAKSNAQPRSNALDIIPHLDIAESNSNDSLLEKVWKSFPFRAKARDKTSEDVPRSKNNGKGSKSDCEVNQHIEKIEVSKSNLGFSSLSTKHRTSQEAWSCVSLSEESILEVKRDAMNNVAKHYKSNGVSLKENKLNQNNKILRNKTKVLECIDTSVLSQKRDYDCNLRMPTNEIRVCYSNDISDTISEVSASTYASSALQSQGLEKSNLSNKRRSHVQPILASKNIRHNHSLHVVTSDSSRRSNL